MSQNSNRKSAGTDGPARSRFSAQIGAVAKGLLLATLLVGGLWAATSWPAHAQSETDSSAGFYYTVRPGDSWNTVAARTGVDVEELKAANPEAVRESGWLIENEQLLIPAQEDAPAVYHTVQSAESWNSIAERYGVSSSLLQAANPRSVRPGLILHRGERLLIPQVSASSDREVVTPTIAVEVTVVATPTTAATATATATATPATVVAQATATPSAASTGAITIPVEITDTVPATGGESIAPVVTLDSQAEEFSIPDCPAEFNGYNALVVEIANRAEDGLGALLEFLDACEALVDEGAIQLDLTGDEVDDLVVVYRNPKQQSIFVESDLLILNSNDGGYTLGYRARAAGDVRLLAAEDINDDGLVDVVWVDTTCGASTCFDTVNVRSWDGERWGDWTNGTITMAYAEIELVAAGEGQGQNIVLTGGIYGSVGAGPQRSRTETWSSVDGEPYTLVDKIYTGSECLYHTVVDANRAFLAAPSEGFDDALALYKQALTDRTLIKCWVRSNELDELRSFSLFRLAVIAGYQGNDEDASARVEELNESYAESIYAQAGDVWLESYLANGDATAACSDVTQFAVANAETWEMLADYGYTNPSFEANNVCPLLTFRPPGEEEGASDEEVDAPSPGQAPAEAEVASLIAALPECPADLAGYSDVLPGVLAAAGTNGIESVESWLRVCGGMTDDRGGVVLGDFNDDGLIDALIFPTIVSDLGFGPRGVQGATYIYHGTENGEYTLVATPDTYGLPQFLAMDDLNNDGNVDLAWTVTGCGAFCVVEMQMWTWDGEEYQALVRPGVLIANGTATLEPVPAGDPGEGMQLLLTGGVSSTPEGGLEVAHTEIWQSLDGGTYQRIHWYYDRDAEGSNCLGLRLVEADVAMQASNALGYQAAVTAYRAALSEDLLACSVFGLAAGTELALLQGLAAFRLVQADALGGDIEAASTTVDALAVVQPDALYTEVASQWLAEFQLTEDPAAACAAVAPLFTANADLWQITDHYGYNHPALAAEQICFVP
jgi:LysM repeat protein